MKSTDVFVKFVEMLIVNFVDIDQKYHLEVETN